jgi:hypothetical protein
MSTDNVIEDPLLMEMSGRQGLKRSMIQPQTSSISSLGSHPSLPNTVTSPAVHIEENSFYEAFEPPVKRNCLHVNARILEILKTHVFVLHPYSGLLIPTKLSHALQDVMSPCTLVQKRQIAVWGPLPRDHVVSHFSRSDINEDEEKQLTLEKMGKTAFTRYTRQKLTWETLGRKCVPMDFPVQWMFDPTEDHDFIHSLNERFEPSSGTENTAQLQNGGSVKQTSVDSSSLRRHPLSNYPEAPSNRIVTRSDISEIKDWKLFARTIYGSVGFSLLAIDPPRFGIHVHFGTLLSHMCEINVYFPYASPLQFVRSQEYEVRLLKTNQELLKQKEENQKVLSSRQLQSQGNADVSMIQSQEARIGFDKVRSNGNGVVQNTSHAPESGMIAPLQATNRQNMTGQQHDSHNSIPHSSEFNLNEFIAPLPQHRPQETHHSTDFHDEALRNDLMNHPSANDQIRFQVSETSHPFGSNNNNNNNNNSHHPHNASLHHPHQPVGDLPGADYSGLLPSSHLDILLPTHVSSRDPLQSSPRHTSRSSRRRENEYGEDVSRFDSPQHLHRPVHPIHQIQPPQNNIANSRRRNDHMINFNNDLFREYRPAPIDRALINEPPPIYSSATPAEVERDIAEERASLDNVLHNVDRSVHYIEPKSCMNFPAEDHDSSDGDFGMVGFDDPVDMHSTNSTSMIDNDIVNHSEDVEGELALSNGDEYAAQHSSMNHRPRPNQKVDHKLNGETLDREEHHLRSRSSPRTPRRSHGKNGVRENHHHHQDEDFEDHEADQLHSRRRQPPSTRSSHPAASPTRSKTRSSSTDHSNAHKISPSDRPSRVSREHVERRR